MYFHLFRCHRSALAIDAEQADQRVAGHDIEVDIGQGLQVIELLRRADQRQEEAQFGDFGGFVHDVDAVEIVDDDLLADVVVDAMGGSRRISAEIAC